jgi:GntP family gluconate:H+ symporter
MAQNENLGFHPVYLCLAIGSGAKLIPWMNDAGFWIMCKTSNLTEREALKNDCPHAIFNGYNWVNFDNDSSKAFSNDIELIWKD